MRTACVRQASMSERRKAHVMYWASSVQRKATAAPISRARPGHGRCRHLDAPSHISLATVHKNEGRLNVSTARS
jgi:hypothetical protein